MPRPVLAPDGLRRATNTSGLPHLRRRASKAKISAREISCRRPPFGRSTKCHSARFNEPSVGSASSGCDRRPGSQCHRRRARRSWLSATRKQSHNCVPQQRAWARRRSPFASNAAYDTLFAVAFSRHQQIRVVVHALVPLSLDRAVRKAAWTVKFGRPGQYGSLDDTPNDELRCETKVFRYHSLRQICGARGRGA
jgi:hypothetical protein